MPLQVQLKLKGTMPLLEGGLILIERTEEFTEELVKCLIFSLNLTVTSPMLDIEVIFAVSFL